MNKNDEAIKVLQERLDRLYLYCHNSRNELDALRNKLKAEEIDLRAFEAESKSIEQTLELLKVVDH